MVQPEDRDFGGAQMRHRQKSGDRIRDDGDRKNLRHLIEYFNLPGAQELYDALEAPDKNRKLPYCGCEPLHVAKSLPSQLPSAGVNFDDLHYLMQVNQARALTTGVEWFRSRQPRCMGTLYWQLNDCWPAVTSWSCIDGDGRAKPLWYATRKFFADELWTFQAEDDGSISLVLVNDSNEEREDTVIVMREDFYGRTLAEQEQRMTVPPRSLRRMRIDQAGATPGDPTREMLTANTASMQMWFFRPDKEIHYPPPQFDAEWSAGKLTIHTKCLLRDVCIFVDRLDPDATVSDQLVTLLPDESFTFDIHSKLPLAKEQLTSPPVFQCVNRFGAGRNGL
jgi:beta-mannosidase